MYNPQTTRCPSFKAVIFFFCRKHLRTINNRSDPQGLHVSHILFGMCLFGSSLATLGNQSGSAGCLPGLGCSCGFLGSQGDSDVPLLSALLDQHMACKPFFQFFNLVFSLPTRIFCHWGSSTRLLEQGCCAFLSSHPKDSIYPYARGKGYFAALYLFWLFARGKKQKKRMLTGDLIYLLLLFVQYYQCKNEHLQPGKSGWETSGPP